MAKFSKSNILVFLISLLVSLAAAELILRAITPAEPNVHQLFCEYDSILGWRKIPNVEGRHVTSEYDILEKMNSQGLRGPEYPMVKDSGETRILVLGDSFAEGYTVEFEELFSEVLKTKMNADCESQIEVINAGTGGYSTDQELLFFENFGVKYQPDVTVLLVCTNDPWFNAQPRYWRGFKPMFVREADSLRLTNVPVPTLAEQPFFEKMKTWGLENSELLRYLKRAKDNLAYSQGDQSVPEEWEVYRRDISPQVEDAWQVTAAILDRLRRKTASAGSELLVFYIPEKIEVYDSDWQNFLTTYSVDEQHFDAQAPRQRLQDICTGLGIPMLDPTEKFIATAQADTSQSLYFELDWHWNANGHRLTGQLIADYLGCPETQILSADSARSDVSTEAGKFFQNKTQ